MHAAAAQIGHWYLARDGQQYGPITDLELGKMVELRHLHPDDFLWREGFEDWVEARRIPGLLAPTPPLPPPLDPRPRGEPTHPATPAPVDRAEDNHDPRVPNETLSQTTTETIIEGGSFKLSTLFYIILGLLFPLWPISLPVFWYLAYRSYLRPSRQTVRVVRAAPGN